MIRIFIIAALLCFGLSCTSQQGVDADRERKARMAGEAINAVQESGELRIIANEKRVVRGDSEVVKPASKHKFSEEVITLEVVDNE